MQYSIGYSWMGSEPSSCRHSQREFLRYPRTGSKRNISKRKGLRDEIVVFAGLQMGRKNPALVGTS